MGEGGFDTGVKIEDLTGKDDVLQELREFVRGNKVPSGKPVYVEKQHAGIGNVIAHRIVMPDVEEGGKKISRNIFVTEKDTGILKTVLDNLLVPGAEWPELGAGKLEPVVVVERGENPNSGINDYSKSKSEVRPATLEDMQKALEELQRALKD